MNTKTCSKCGWVYPANWHGRACRFCRTVLTEGYCAKCGIWSDKLHLGYYCTDCYTQIHYKWKNARKQTAEEAYKEWLELIAKVPKPYKTLTEEQWLEACKFFGGCAYCGSNEIACREMFIPYKQGGRYCVWNIIPTCECCATKFKTIENPFYRMDNVLHRSTSCVAKQLGYTTERTNIIVDYLRGRLDNE